MKIDRLTYITFFTLNFQEVVGFYRDTLGLEVERLDADFVRFRTAGGFRLAFNYAEQPVLAKPASEIHFEVPDVDAAFAELKGRGVTFESEPADMPWGVRLAICRDPEGFRVELIGPPAGKNP